MNFLKKLSLLFLVLFVCLSLIYACGEHDAVCDDENPCCYSHEGFVLTCYKHDPNWAQGRCYYRDRLHELEEKPTYQQNCCGRDAPCDTNRCCPGLYYANHRCYKY